MQVNTKTGAIKLTKRERQVITDATTLLRNLEKHGEGELSHHAEQAGNEIDATLQELRRELVAETPVY